MIHPTAIIDPKAELASDIEVGPYAVIGADVKIDSGTTVGAHAVIKGITEIGKNNKIFQFTSIGEDCQDKKYNGEPTRLEIGDDNHFREFCTVHRGTVQDQGLTKIGSRGLFMNYVHIAHDCVIGDDVIIGNSTNLAGHVTIGDFVIISGACGIHQFCKIGSYAMLGGHTVLLKDAPAFVMVMGSPSKVYTMNFEGMKRKGFSKETMAALKKAYSIVYRQGHTLEKALEILDETFPEPDEMMQIYRESFNDMTRGLTR